MTEPTRSCVGCGRKAPQSEFLRFVAQDGLLKPGAGESAFATKRAGSGFHGMMSIFSPRSSDTTIRTRDPRGPTQAPTGSTPCACDSTAILDR